MANKLKAQVYEVRAAIAKEHARVIRKQNPDWTLQQVNSAAYRAADLQIKRGEVRIS